MSGSEMRSLLFVLLLFLSLSSSNCGGGGTNLAVTHGDPVTISPKTATVLVADPNGVQQFQAVVQGANSSAVDWLVNGMVGGSATVGTISSTGLYTAPNAVGSSSVTVTARSQADPTQVDSATVTLQYPMADASSVTPNQLQAGSSAAIVTIKGAYFSSAASAYLAGNPLPTTFVSTKQLAATIPAAALAMQDTLFVGVKNPQPGGGGTDGTNNSGAPVYVVSGEFVRVGDLNIARESHTATLLPNGKVLIAGGSDASGNALTSAELFDPQTNTFQITGVMTASRMGHSATLLQNGKVLIAGGKPNSQTAELYDPASGTFTAITQQMTYPHQNHSVLLNNGKVLLQDLLDGFNFVVVANADIYDPSSNTFTAVPTANSPSGSSSNPPCLGGATLGNGNNLVVVGAPYYLDTVTLSYALADPTGSSDFGLQGCSITLLKDGTIFAAGGWTTTFNIFEGSRAQVWNPSTQKDTLSFNMPCSLSGQAAALLQSGQVLLTSGGGCASSDEIFDPNRGQVFIGPNTIIPRHSTVPTATLLPDGRILIIGGVGANNPSPIAETYVPPKS